MQGYVFRLYQKGQRMPVPIGPVRGDVHLQKRNDGTGNIVAQVVGTGGWQLLPVHYAKVELIMGGGLVIKGTEFVPRRSNNKANADRCRQVWWAMTDPDAVQAVRLGQLKHRHRLDLLERQSLEAECAVGGWTAPYRFEVDRLVREAAEREREMARIEARLQKRAADGRDGAVHPPALPRD